jgi:hypothetical protein
VTQLLCAQVSGYPTFEIIRVLLHCQQAVREEETGDTGQETRRTVIATSVLPWANSMSAKHRPSDDMLTCHLAEYFQTTILLTLSIPHSRKIPTNTTSSFRPHRPQRTHIRLSHEHPPISACYILKHTLIPPPLFILHTSRPPSVYTTSDCWNAQLA